MDYSELNDQAKYFFDKKLFDQALKVLNIPGLPDELKPNLAKCFYYTSQAERALECIEGLPFNHELSIDRALYLNALGNFDQAFDIYKGLDNSDPKVKFNIGWHYLRHDEFQKGFQNLQYGSECRAWGSEYILLEQGKLNRSKRWDGSYQKRLLLILEGGLGDEMIFLRWGDYLKNKCDELVILCNESLLRLLINSGYNAYPHQVLTGLHYDAYIPAMSLPAISKELTAPTTAVNFPYISSYEDRYIVKQIKETAGQKKRIGVRFFGNKEFEHDQFRSPPKEQLVSILSKFGQLFSIQIDEEDNRFPNCKHVIRDWQDTYSVFKSLDLLVTSCTSTAHLAGAMGIQTIVLTPLVPYFIWASNSMPWYGNNVEVIKQTKYNDWNTAMGKLQGRLDELY